jgi:hypothetical protein
LSAQLFILEIGFLDHDRFGAATSRPSILLIYSSALVAHATRASSAVSVSIESAITQTAALPLARTARSRTALGVELQTTSVGNGASGTASAAHAAAVTRPADQPIYAASAL